MPKALLAPELEYDFWDTTLPTQFSPAEVIRLYQDHGTHEQFRSEFKTDLDLERLPSGKFATNDCVLEANTVLVQIDGRPPPTA